MIGTRRDIASPSRLRRAAIARVTGLVLALLVPHVTVAQPASPREAAAVVREALAAYESGRAELVAARWRSTRHRTPLDRRARLGLAYLEYLHARYPTADSAFTALLRDTVAGDATITQALLGRSIVAGQQAQFPRADTLASLAVARARRTQDAWGAAAALTRLAQYRVRTSGVQPALTLLVAADSFAQRVGAEPQAAVSCMRAQIHVFADDTLTYRDAQRGLTLLAGKPPSRLRSACLFSTGQYFFNRGTSYADSSARYFRRAADEQRRLRDWAGRAAALQWLGATLQFRGRFSDAGTAYRAAIADAERSGNRSALAWATMGLGQMQADFGNDAGAAPLLTKAADMLQQQRDQFGYMTASIALMFLRLRRGDAPGVAAQLPTVEATLRRLGDPLARQRALEVALHAARVSEERTRARDIADTLAVVMARDGHRLDLNYDFLRGLTALEAGDLDAAERFYLAGTSGKSSDVAAYVALARLAEIAAARGTLGVAEQRLRDANERVARFRRALQEPDLRRNALRTTVADPVDPDLGVATVINTLATGGRTAAAFTFAAERRARDWLDALLRASLPRADTLARQAARDRAGAVTSDSAVRAALLPGEAMLFYVTGARREPTTLFVLTREKLSATTVMSADSLRPLARRLRRQISAGGPTQALQQQLGARVITPALSLLPATVTRLHVVSDGPLQDLPFDALLLPNGQSVLERFDLSTHATPAVLPLLRDRARASRGLGALALAVERPGRRSPVDGATLPDLRQAAREARTTASRYSNGRALVGGDAREALLYRRTARLATLHIAAHTAIDPIVESNSAIMLASGDGQDGDLHIWEMEDLGVTAGLVVLSGCRTGLAEGAMNSEGVLGFTAPLLLAGTQSVVATQWDLPDNTAAEIMADFHRELASGRDAGAALRAAKRAQLARGRSPAHWAVFQLIGDPAYRVVSPR